MNLALHGLLLQVILSILDIKHGLCSAGEPGYLDFDNLPETNFSCQGKVIGGYYADVEAGCQMFHVCTIGQKDEIMDIKFLCLNGTVFDQETRVCERVDEVDCSKSERFYNLNLELYGNNAVTLSLQEDDNNDEPPILIDNHHQSSSPRPSTTPPSHPQSTTTPPHPSLFSTSSSVSYQNPNGYPQSYHPQPPFPSVQTSQSKSRYDDKNGGYHRQYIYHTGDSTLQNGDNNDNNNNDNNQATSYQLFSNHHQGASSTTLTPQHQLHHQLSTVSPLYHATSSTLQTLLTGNANNNDNNNNNNNNNNNDNNNQRLLNALYNNAIVSTTEQFTIHANNPRETHDYRNSNDNLKSNDDRRILEPIQSTSQGKISKLSISPVPHDEKLNVSPTIRSFYPTPKTPKSQTSTTRVTQHIHLPPPPPIPQLKPHQVTIHLSPPEIQRIVQNPSPLLPSQSRVIVTAKASVSDESGRPLNTTQLVTLPLPTIPASYDDYKEGDESFDPFYRDVPKIRSSRRSDDEVRILLAQPRRKRTIRSRREVSDVDVDNVDVERSAIEPKRFEEEEYKEVEEDYSTAVGDERSEEERKISDDYYDDYSNESQSSDGNSLGKANAFDGKESQEYDSQEYLYSEEEDNNSTEYFNAESVTEESESITENPTTMEIEITGLIDSLNKSEDTVVKFTEEIPGSVEKDTSHDVKEQVDNPDVLRDYVDDNYEPHSYREEEMMTVADKENVTKSIGEFGGDLESVTDGGEGEGLDDSVTTLSTVEESSLSDLEDTSPTTPATATTLTSPATTTELTTHSTTTELTTPPTTTELTTPLTTMELTTLPTTTEFTTPTSITELTTPPTTMELTTPSTTMDFTTPSIITELTTPSTTTVSTTPSTTTTSTTPSTTTTSTTPSTTIISTTPSTTTILTIASTTPATITVLKASSTPARRRYTTATTPIYKPTAPKLKTFPTRKNYVYIPPTTTPLSVVIKTRLPLYNPKPAKPPRSYNELAPKPIIRKRPLLARRPSSTVNDDDFDDTTTVEPITTTKTPEVLMESVEFTTEKVERLSERLLEKLSETIGEEVIEQINDLTTTISVPDDLIDMATTSNDNSTSSGDSISRNVTETTTEDAKAESSTDERLTQPSAVHPTTFVDAAVVTSSTLASVLPVNRKPIGAYKRVSGFNCLEKEMYRFYADKRDCRLFHYCSPGFTPRQVLDFRFVCEEGTAFDEVTQNCLHDVKNLKCEKKSW